MEIEIFFDEKIERKFFSKDFFRRKYLQVFFDSPFLWYVHCKHRNTSFILSMTCVAYKKFLVKKFLWPLKNEPFQDRLHPALEWCSMGLTVYLPTFLVLGFSAILVLLLSLCLANHCLKEATKRKGVSDAEAWSCYFEVQITR